MRTSAATVTSPSRASGSDRPQRTQRSLKLGDGVDQAPERAAETIQSPDHERVAGGEELEAGVELGAVFERPGADVVKRAAAAGLLERVELQREVGSARRWTRGRSRFSREPTGARGANKRSRVLAHWIARVHGGVR